MRYSCGGIFLHFKPVELEDRRILNPYFNEWQFENSELNFSNLFLWQHIWNIRYSIVDECLYLALKRNGMETMFAPIPSKKGASLKVPIQRAKEYFRSIGQPFNMCCVTHELMDYIDACCNEKLDAIPDRNNFDYVYLASDLGQLPGSKYHSKRNHIEQFVSNYRYTYSALEDRHIPACLELCMEWIKSKNGTMPYLKDEYNAIKLALENKEILDISGCVIEIEGKVQAFSIGEQITNDMAVIHFEKANSEVKGLYASINKLFVQNRWSHLTYINREEDMGYEGLRKSKSSYHPARMLEKYTLTAKEDEINAF